MKLRRAMVAGMAGVLMNLASTPLSAENIGNAREGQPNARSKALTRIFSTLIGTWNAKYTYYDLELGRYVVGSAVLTYAQTPIPNVHTLYAVTQRPGLPPIQVFTTMVMQADGSSQRQMAFTNVGGRVQDKVITNYTYVDDRNWTMDMLEVQQGLGAASAVVVKMVTKNGHVDMRKYRSLEGAPADKRPYESLAEYDIKK